MSTEDERAWHVYDLHTQDNGEITGECSTNDNRDQGFASESAIWPVRFKNYETMEKQTGLSHIGINGCEVKVFLDGKLLERTGSAAAPSPTLSGPAGHTLH
jgi:hypothetical protein